MAPASRPGPLRPAPQNAYASFLSFAKAARARGVITMEYEKVNGDWYLEPA